HLTAFRVQDDGTLADKRILFDFGPNRRGIDGMAMDSEGNVYATAGSGDEAGVYVFGPDGKHLALIHTPGTPTNCTFGGPEEPTALYVTAGVAARDSSADRTERFGLYRIELSIPGEQLALAGEDSRPAKWAQPVEMAGVPNLFRLSDGLYRSG